MKNLNEYVNNEPIDEALGTVSILVLFGIAEAIICGLIAKGSEKLMQHTIEKYDPHYILSATDKLLRDKEAVKILKKVAKNDKVKDFLTLSEYEQKGKWRKLLKEILPEDEYEKVYGVAKYAIKDLIKKDTEKK